MRDQPYNPPLPARSVAFVGTTGNLITITGATAVEWAVEGIPGRNTSIRRADDGSFHLMTTTEMTGMIRVFRSWGELLDHL